MFFFAFVCCLFLHHCQSLFTTNLELDVYISTGLVDMYCKMGQLDRVREVFDKMPKPDIVSWNAIIASISEDGDPS